MNCVCVPEKIVVLVPEKKLPEVRQKLPLISSTPVSTETVPPSIASVESEVTAPDDTWSVPPGTHRKSLALYVPAPTSSVPPSRELKWPTTNAPPASRTTPPLCVKSCFTRSVPESSWSVVLPFTGSDLTVKSPARCSVLGEVSESVTSRVESGTPAGSQYAPSPQCEVPAPPAQDEAGPPALAGTKEADPGARSAVEVTVPDDWV